MIISLGIKLIAARKKTELTQAEMALSSGFNVNYYARIERGEENPSYEKLNKIMKALGIKSLDVFEDGPLNPRILVSLHYVS